MTRALAVVAALVVAGFFAIAVRQSHNAALANERLGHGPALTAADQKRVADQINRAGQLKPGTEADVQRVQLAVASDQPQRGLDLLQAITRREPDNLNAWITLRILATAQGRQALADHARDNVARLSPERPPA